VTFGKRNEFVARNFNLRDRFHASAPSYRGLGDARSGRGMRRFLSDRLIDPLPEDHSTGSANWSASSNGAIDAKVTPISLIPARNGNRVAISRSATAIRSA
jgi:hypothetical protein